jgi:hypothetical protein
MLASTMRSSFRMVYGPIHAIPSAFSRTVLLRFILCFDLAAQLHCGDRRLDRHVYCVYFGTFRYDWTWCSCSRGFEPGGHILVLAKCQSSRIRDSQQFITPLILAQASGVPMIEKANKRKFGDDPAWKAYVECARLVSHVGVIVDLLAFQAYSSVLAVVQILIFVLLNARHNDTVLQSELRWQGRRNYTPDYTGSAARNKTGDWWPLSSFRHHNCHPNACRP